MTITLNTLFKFTFNVFAPAYIYGTNQMK